MTEKLGTELELTNNYLKKCLDEVIKQNGFVTYDIDLSPGSMKGDNYAGIVHKIAISGVKDNGEKSILYLFSKTPVQIENIYNNFEMKEQFIHEIRFYNEILKDIKEFSANKTMKHEVISYVECLATGSEDRQEFLLMEDITKRNFSMFDQTKELDLNHMQLVMKALGKFHAYNFAIRDQKPELFKTYSENFKEIFMKVDMSDTVVAFLGVFLKMYVDELQFEGIYQEKWENFHKNYYQILKKCCKGELAEPFAVISHGDCWNRNMMFKYEKEIPIEVCLFDWQRCCYTSPILDLVGYIFGSTDKAFRDENYEILLNIYYDTFSSFLKQLGSDPEILFPYTAFQDQLKKFGKWGLAIVLIITKIVTRKDDELGAEVLMENDDNVDTVNIWSSKVADILRDMVALCYL